MHLPIVRRCPAHVELRPDPQGRTYCDHCSTHVQLLSEMRERDARAWLAAHEGQQVCVGYRVRRDGSIAFRRDSARPWLAPALAGVTACAPQVQTAMPDEAVITGEGCPLPGGNVTTAASSATVVRVDFRIDPNDEVRMGMIVGIDDHHRPDRSDRLEWIPTKKLWKDFIARVRARRAR
jgi:hypothetical protein